MAKAQKKAKDDAPNPNSVPNREVMQRMSFLYQASVYLNSISSSSPAGDGASMDVQTSQAPTFSNSNPAKRNPKRQATAGDLSRSYIGAMRSIGHKTVVKMDPGIKRTLCRDCGTVLIPGSSATVRTKSSTSHGHSVTYTCVLCGASRRIPAPPVLHEQLTAEASTEDALTASSPPSLKRKKQKQPPVPRRKPLFEQSGHIIFRGNERMEE